MALPPFDEDALRAKLEKLAAESPPEPGVNPALELAVAMVHVLEARTPGFRAEVPEAVLARATLFEASSDAEDVADAPSLRELADSSIFIAETF